MAPVKFGDFAKSATEILDDDYQTSTFQVKAKHVTQLDGANVTTATDLWPEGAVKTHAKITWKFPKPFGIKGVSIDKLEMTKSGDFAAELALSDGLHQVKGLSLSAKSDLVAPNKATVGATFTGLADTRIQVDTKATNPADFTLEVTRAVQSLTLGAKLSKKDTTPNLGVRLVSDPFFAALVVSDKLKQIKVYGCFKVQDNLKVAGSVEYPSLAFSKGIVYEASPTVKVKAKFAHDGTVSASMKNVISKGFTAILGGKYGVKSGKMSYGMSVSIE